MSSSIEIQAHSAILDMLVAQQDRLITELARKYDFDAKEARRSLPTLTSVACKEVKPRKPKESKPDKAESKPKGKGKAKSGKDVAKELSDEEKPKKAKTGYLLFCDAARSSARTKLEATAVDGEKVMAKHVVTLLASHWKDLDEEDRNAWKERAERIKAGEGHLLQEIEVDLGDSDEE